MHQVRALRWSSVFLLVAAALVIVYTMPPALLAAEPTPAPAVTAAHQDDMAGPLIGLSLAMASSALAVGIALGLRRRIDEIGEEGDTRNQK